MLTIIGGPMFAGKTTWLLDHISNLDADSFVLFKPSLDTRYATDACVTHDGQEFTALNLNHTQPVFPDFSDPVTTLLLDELNFYDAQLLIPQLQKQLDQGRTIIGAGLLYDFQQKPFGATQPLSKIADRFIELFASCDSCGQPGEFNYRKKKLGGVVQLGAAELYGVSCQKCWSKFDSPN